jgi:hypothetical protein
MPLVMRNPTPAAKPGNAPSGSGGAKVDGSGGGVPGWVVVVELVVVTVVDVPPGIVETVVVVPGGDVVGVTIEVVVTVTVVLVDVLVTLVAVVVVELSAQMQSWQRPWGQPPPASHASPPATSTTPSPHDERTATKSRGATLAARTFPRMVVQSGSMRAFKRTLRSIPHSGQRVRSVLPLRVALRRARFGSHPLSIASVRAPGSVTTASTTIGTSPRTRVTPSETKKRPGGQSGGLADPTRGAARGTPNASNNAHAAGRRGANQYRRRAYTFVVRATSRRSG